MLRARTEKGTIITLASFTREEIENLRQVHTFTCPICNENVIMKVGTVNIPHFAHQSSINCPSYEGGEGPYHEKGKVLLYQWLKSQHLDVELEAYISTINQRPDILLKLNDKKVAIEFQCARVRGDEIRKRNQGYKKAGIIPIWILGANRFKRQGRYHMKLDQFTLQFIHQFSSDYPLQLFYFCPHTLQLVSVQQIYLTSMRQAICTLQFTSLAQLRFKHLFVLQSLPPKKLFTLWKTVKRKFRLHIQKHAYGKQMAWLQWLYTNRTHVQYLPSIIHLPIQAQYRMKTPTWDWQSRICLDMLDHIPIGASISLQSCIYKMKPYIYPSNNFPLINNQKHPIKEYFQLLEKLNILKEIRKDSFIKLKPIIFHKNIEESLKADEVIMNDLIKTVQNKKQA